MSLLICALLASGCGAAPGATPAITPGTARQPRDVNIIASDFAFQPRVVDLVPGETVMLHVINGGLVAHDAIFGDQTVQDAWEIAEAGAADPPPGPTPLVSVPPGVGGLRIVVNSGQRVDVRWTVPDSSAAGASAPRATLAPRAAASAGIAATADPSRPILLVPTGQESGLIVGCHIAGHYARGMHVPIRFVAPGT